MRVAVPSSTWRLVPLPGLRGDEDMTTSNREVRFVTRSWLMVVVVVVVRIGEVERCTLTLMGDSELAMRRGGVLLDCRRLSLSWRTLSAPK